MRKDLYDYLQKVKILKSEQGIILEIRNLQIKP